MVYAGSFSPVAGQVDFQRRPWSEQHQRGFHRAGWLLISQRLDGCDILAEQGAWNTLILFSAPALATCTLSRQRAYQFW